MQLGILLLRKIFGVTNGVAVGTQPLSLIMEEKVRSTVVPTAVVTMQGQIKQHLDERGEAQLSSPKEDLLQGKFPLLIGHPESWSNPVGQELLRNLQEKGMVLFNFVDEMHQGLEEHWNSIRYKNVSKFHMFLMKETRITFLKLNLKKY